MMAVGYTPRASGAELYGPEPSPDAYSVALSIHARCVVLTGSEPAGECGEQGGGFG